jgi:hypothetical protein
MMDCCLLGRADTQVRPYFDNRSLYRILRVRNPYYFLLIFQQSHKKRWKGEGIMCFKRETVALSLPFVL